MFNPLTDQPDFFTGFLEFIAGVFFFPIVFISIQTFFRFSQTGQKICRKYGLNLHAILDISNKATSSTFALLACLTGLYVINGCKSGLGLEGRFYILDNYLIFGVSYFFYDTLSMFLVFAAENDSELSLSLPSLLSFLVSRPLIVLHHLLVPLLGFPTLMVARQGTGDCLLGAAFLIEASTPFVSARVVLVHLKMKEHIAYLVNGILMLLSFLVCRVLLFPFLYLCYLSATGQSLSQLLLNSPLWCHLLAGGLWLPQLIWFSKMLRGSLKILNKRRRKEPQTKEEKEEERHEDENSEAPISEEETNDSIQVDEAKEKLL